MKKRGGEHMCPVCNSYAFPREDSHDECRICAWEDDALQIDKPNMSGANEMSLNQAIEAYMNGEKVL